MSGISRQLMMLLPLFLVAGCATERYSIRGIVQRPHGHGRSTGAAVAPHLAPHDNYSPHVEEEIPMPPSGASFEQVAPETPTTTPAPKLQKVERPPLLLRPVGWEFIQPEAVISLRAPQPIQ